MTSAQPFGNAQRSGAAPLKNWHVNKLRNPADVAVNRRRDPVPFALNGQGAPRQFGTQHQPHACMLFVRLQGPTFYGPDSLNPPYESGGKTDGGEVVSCQPIVSRCDAPEVLQPVERSLDAPAQLVEAFAEAERALPIAAVGNDRLGSAPLQFLAQFGTVVGLVAEQAFGFFNSADETLGDRTIVRLASGQQDGNETPFSICECMDLRVAPAARAAHSLFVLPPFPPDAERCALTWVDSIILVAVDQPLPPRCRNKLSQIPRSAQRTKRL